jgi:3-(3-hydroxy-phenyl)propionate hydroxylase
VRDHDVVVAGGGPTGLMLAGELALAGVDVVIVERRTNQDLDGSRAGGLHSRTLEVLDQRGIAERFLAEGQRHPAVGYAYIQLDISDLPTRHNYLLALWQRDIERLLAEWVLGDLAVPILRGYEIIGSSQLDDEVVVDVAGRPPIRAEYLVGCDGGRSTVRKTAAIGFPGFDPSVSFLIAEVKMAEAPEVGVRPEGGGIGPVDRQRGGNPYNVVLREPQPDSTAEPTLDDLRTLLVAAYGTDFGVGHASWISRFTDASRQAASYRSGRVLLAGDAAHIHSPHGGQGLNTGVQDAVNLGWKLAQVVHGISPDTLLDTYHAERHPVGARVLRNTMAQVALTTPDDRHRALHDATAELLAMTEPRTRMAAMLAGLDIHYELGGGHPLVGRRMLDLDITTAEGSHRLFELLHDARPILLHFGEPGGLDAEGVPARVRRVDAAHHGPWHLPVLGEVEPPAAALIRPDGHVAWAGSPGDPALAPEALTWFGGGAAGGAVRGRPPNRTTGATAG